MLNVKKYMFWCLSIIEYCAVLFILIRCRILQSCNEDHRLGQQPETGPKYIPHAIKYSYY